MSTLAEALAPRSDQLNADDLIPGPRTLKITGARIAKDGRDIRIVLNYEGDNGKPWKPCKTMGRAMVMAWAVTEPEQIVGKFVRVYRDPEVRFGDQGQVGGIRISHMSHLERAAKMKLTVSQGKKAEFTFQPLPTQVAAQSADDLPDDPAFKFANAYIRKVAACTSLEELAIYEAEKAPRMAELAEKRPDQHKRARDAAAARFKVLEATALEGRSDDQHGDQFDGGDA